MELKAGALISRAVNIWLTNFAAFAAIMLVVNIPRLLLTGWIMTKLSSDSPLDWLGPLQTFQIVTIVLSILLGSVASGAITYIVVKRLDDQAVSVGEAIGAAMGALPRLIGTAIVAGVAVTVGLVLLVVPGLIVATMLSVAPVAAVVEKTGVGDSLARSRSLTEGHRWTVFGAYVALGILVAIGGFLVGKIVGGSPSGLDIGELRSSITRSLLVGNVYDILAGGLSATLPAILYTALRQEKEGVDTAFLARVFQ